MLRWGLLGTAHINRRLIPAIRANRRSALVAVASRDAERGDAYAKQWAIPTRHVGYDALLADRDIDAIYLSLPNSLHVEWTLAAIAAGKHVLCEKPLALTAAEVDRVIAAATAAKVAVSEGFIYRHEPLTARAVRLTREEAIGPATTISAGFTYMQERPNDVRLRADLGGGSLWDIGCYAVSYARLLAGAEPVEVFGWAAWTDGGVDDAFSGLLRFPSGLIATVHSSFRAGYRHWVEVGGRDGQMRIANPYKPGAREEIEVRRGDITRRVLVDGSLEPFVREVADFVAAVLDGQPPVVSLGESRGNAAALDALYASARSGRPVSLSAPAGAAPTAAEPGFVRS